MFVLEAFVIEWIDVINAHGDHPFDGFCVDLLELEDELFIFCGILPEL